FLGGVSDAMLGFKKLQHSILFVEAGMSFDIRSLLSFLGVRTGATTLDSGCLDMPVWCSLIFVDRVITT
ncbi:hypothetical protein OAG82_02950, partial [Rubripirellula sp.]